MATERKPYSRARRTARWVVWAAFAVVLVVRYVLFPDLREERSANRGGHDREWRRYRPPTVVRPPASEVPKDLFRIQIEIGPKDVDVLRRYYWDRHGDQDDRPKVLATVREGGSVYSNVAVNLKGAAGSFRAFDDKPALTLNFGKHVPGQKFHGYSKISLNNSVQDETYLCEAISRELFDAAGVPVPRAEHATVLINDRDLGLYVLVEGYNKDFLRRYFSQVKGNLYDGGFCQEVHPRLDTNSGDYPKDRSDLEQLLAALSERDPKEQWNQLNRILDMKRFIAMMAMEVLTCHWDGYSLNRNNYRIFHNRETGRLIFMPHGMDQMFGRFRSSPQSSIFPDMQGMVSRAVLSASEGRKQYFQTVGHLFTNVFDPKNITNRVHELARKIRPTLAAYHPDFATAHDYNVTSLCDRIMQRAQSVAEQLNRSWEPIPFDENGAALLTNWVARGSGRVSAILVPSDTVQPGSSGTGSLFHLKSDHLRAAGSWRASALLEPGQYRFEARVRVNKLEGSGGAWLRVNGSQESSAYVEQPDWTPISMRFWVREPLRDVELICEFRDARGEAWFDADSIRLVRE